MRWDDFRSSGNVEDRRGMGGGGGLARGGGLGIGAVMILTLVGWALGIDPRLLIGGAEMVAGGGSGYSQQQQPQPRGQAGAPQDEGGRFVAAILGNTEDVWREQLPKQVNRQYVDPKLVIFSGQTRSGCGAAQSAMGPFYCPLDQTIYLDLTFFNDMKTRFRAGGDFAYAYVIAHEVGHHLENVLGILPRVQERQREVSKSEANRLSVRVELMEHFGFFVTESSGHASEYVPYFRKSARMVEEELVPRFKDEADHWFDFGRTGGYVRHCIEVLEESQEHYQRSPDGEADLPTERTHEYGSYIIEAIETNEPIRVNGNVPNAGLIEGLPRGCCVEVPCLVDTGGVQPTVVGYYPPQLAALNRTNINVQELTVEAALTGDTEAVYHAVMLDPLTAAVCTLPEISSMVGEMLDAQARWLPQF